MKKIEQLGISPAPWRKQGNSLITGTIIASDGTDVIDYGWNRYLIGKYGDQNARLISAAPDLYEALRECLEVLDEVEECFQEVDEETSKMMGKARAAIEKAGGAE